MSILSGLRAGLSRRLRRLADLLGDDDRQGRPPDEPAAPPLWEPGTSPPPHWLERVRKAAPGLVLEEFSQPGGPPSAPRGKAPASPPAEAGAGVAPAGPGHPGPVGPPPPLTGSQAVPTEEPALSGGPAPLPDRRHRAEAPPDSRPLSGPVTGRRHNGPRRAVRRWIRGMVPRGPEAPASVVARPDANPRFAQPQGHVPDRAPVPGRETPARRDGPGHADLAPGPPDAAGAQRPSPGHVPSDANLRRPDPTPPPDRAQGDPGGRDKRLPQAPSPTPQPDDPWPVWAPPDESSPPSSAASHQAQAPARAPVSGPAPHPFPATPSSGTHWPPRPAQDPWLSAPPAGTAPPIPAELSTELPTELPYPWPDLPEELEEEDDAEALHAGEHLARLEREQARL